MTAKFLSNKGLMVSSYRGKNMLYKTCISQSIDDSFIIINQIRIQIYNSPPIDITNTITDSTKLSNLLDDVNGWINTNKIYLDENCNITSALQEYFESAQLGIQMETSSLRQYVATDGILCLIDIEILTYTHDAKFKIGNPPDVYTWWNTSINCTQKTEELASSILQAQNWLLEVNLGLTTIDEVITEQIFNDFIEYAQNITLNNDTYVNTVGNHTNVLNYTHNPIA